MEPKVSVIIPVYNVEKYLGPCLDSILGQTLNNIEVICVDDGSTDRSLEILREYEKRDARVKVLTQPNTNAGAARNKGIQQAKGEYLSFLDSDDHFDPTMLEKCAARMDQDGSDVLVFGAKQHNMRTGIISDMPWSLRLDRCPQKSVFPPREVKDYLFNNFQNWPWNKLFRRSFVEQHHITYQEITRTNDMAFVEMRCMAAAANFIAGMTSVIFLSLVMLIMDVRLAFIAMAGFVPAWFVYNATKRAFHAAGVKRQSMERDLIGAILEYVSGMETIRSYRMSGHVFGRINDRLADYRDAAAAYELKALPPMMLYQLFVRMGMGLIFLCGLVFYLNDMVSLPVFLFFAVISGTYYQPVEALLGEFGLLNIMTLSLDHIDALHARLNK